MNLKKNDENNFLNQISLINNKFSNISRILDGFNNVKGILFDLGYSTAQVKQNL